MSHAASLVAQLAAAGTPPELLAQVAEALFSGEIGMKAIADRREADRIRQANRRMSRDVTGQTVTDCDPILDKKSPQTPTKTKPFQVPPIIPQNWNEMAAKYGLPQIQSITGKRLKALKARIAEHGEEAVLRAISNVPNSPHWLGANGWLGNFDSLLRPDNFQRMIEGTYAGKAEQPKGKPLTAEDYEKLAVGWEKIGRDDEAAECRRKAKALPIGQVVPFLELAFQSQAAGAAR